mgnify:FL=1
MNIFSNNQGLKLKHRKVRNLIKIGVRVLAGLVVSLVVTIGLGVGLAVKSASQVYQSLDLITKGEVGISQVEASEIKAVYQLNQGWNLVAFPVKPVNFRNASGLILDVAKKGGYVTTVSKWDGDRCIEFVQRGKDQFGFDFEITPGQAYFLQNQKEVSWQVIGEPVLAKDLNEYRLEKGWNTIGLLDESLDARQVIDGINQGVERATVIDWWTTAGNWELFIKRLYSADDVQEYGENFKIDRSKGYMIFVNESVDWRVR